MNKEKVFKKPGQKKTTPPPSDPLYRFYTSLLRQKPESKLAMKWCVEHGVLSKAKAEQLLLILEMDKLQLKDALKISKTFKANIALQKSTVSMKSSFKNESSKKSNTSKGKP